MKSRKNIGRSKKPLRRSCKKVGKLKIQIFSFTLAGDFAKMGQEIRTTELFFVDNFRKFFQKIPHATSDNFQKL